MKIKDISKIGLGCYALSGAYGKVDVDQYKQVLRRGFDLGINFFDTADTYGETAERVLGEALSDVREEVFISTKVGVSKGEKPFLSRDRVIEACKRSLARLGTEHIDLYLVHFDDPGTPVEETVGAMEYLQDQQMITHYGVSHIPTHRIQEYIKKGKPSFLMFEYSPVARDAQRDLFKLIQEHDLNSLAFSVTGRGILSGNITRQHRFAEGDIRNMDPLFKYARFESALRISEKMKDVGHKHGMSPVQVAIAWVLSHPEITCALTGPSTIEHMEENAASVDFLIPREDLEEIHDFLDMEEERTKRDDIKIVERLLNAPLDRESGFNDLVYVFETAVNRGWVGEDEIMPMFMELFKVREEPKVPLMKEIQYRLREMIFN